MKYVNDGDTVRVKYNGREVLVEVKNSCGHYFRGVNELLQISHWFYVEEAQEEKADAR